VRLFIDLLENSYMGSMGIGTVVIKGIFPVPVRSKPTYRTVNIPQDARFTVFFIFSDSEFFIFF